MNEEWEKHILELHTFVHEHPLQSVPWELLHRCNLINRTPRTTIKTAGKILLHARRQIMAFRETIGISICVFKIGVTGALPQRFLDYVAINFDTMWAVFCSDDVSLVHMLEAALICEFSQLPGCRNSPNTGGEGALNRTNHSGPPYFVYITGAKADQSKRIG